MNISFKNALMIYWWILASAHFPFTIIIESFSYGMRSDDLISRRTLFLPDVNIEGFIAVTFPLRVLAIIAFRVIITILISTLSMELVYDFFSRMPHVITKGAAFRYDFKTHLIKSSNTKARLPERLLAFTDTYWYWAAWRRFDTFAR